MSRERKREKREKCNVAYDDAHLLLVPFSTCMCILYPGEPDEMPTLCRACSSCDSQHVMLEIHIQLCPREQQHCCYAH